MCWPPLIRSHSQVYNSIKTHALTSNYRAFPNAACISKLLKTVPRRLVWKNCKYSIWALSNPGCVSSLPTYQLCNVNAYIQLLIVKTRFTRNGLAYYLCIATESMRKHLTVLNDRFTASVAKGTPKGGSAATEALSTYHSELITWVWMAMKIMRFRRNWSHLTIGIVVLV